MMIVGNTLGDLLCWQSTNTKPNYMEEGMTTQRTLAKSVSCAGRSLHLGRVTTITMSPAPPDSGIVFRRSDLPGSPEIRAEVANVIDTNRCMVIGNAHYRIGTVEHLLSAAHGLGLDNALVEVDGEELPVGDGSALFFANLLLEAGLIEQSRPRRLLRVCKPVWVAENGSYLVALPSPRPGLSVSFTFSADSRVIGAQYYQYTLGVDDYLREIAPARTIAFVEEIQSLRDQGLARSEDAQAVVMVGPDGYLNDLRLRDEIVRHKILDLLGDLYLVSGPLHGQIIAVRSGHHLNYKLGQALSEPGVVETQESD